MKSMRVSTVHQKPFHFTSVQRDVIRDLSAEGMSGIHLDLWTPRTNQEETSIVNVGAETMIFDNRFKAAHAKALIALVKEYRLAPTDAVNEINCLTAREAELLIEFYAEGLTGEFIRNNRQHYLFESAQLASHLRFLLSKKVSFANALHELYDLCEFELILLADFYKQGLRGNHLRENRIIADKCSIYQLCRDVAARGQGANKAKHKDAIAYFNAIVQYSLKQRAAIGSALLQAASELNVIYNNVAKDIEGDITGVFHTESFRLNFLQRHIQDGIKALHTDEVISAEQLKTFYVLKLMHKLSSLEAILQVKGLSDDKAAFLRQHFNDTVNHHTLSTFPHHAEFIKYYMKKNDKSATDVISELRQLSPNQLLYYYQLEDVGVTYDTALAMDKNAPYSQVRIDVAKALISERGAIASDVLNEVISNNEKDLLEMLRERRPIRSQIIC